MRVLVAEDDPVIGLGLGERLRALGHEPIGPAADGAEAIAVAEQTHPDLYLFDIEMPTLDGLTAATWLADEGLRRPVVVITGVEEPQLVERSIASGVSAYLTKPMRESSKRRSSLRAYDKLSSKLFKPKSSGHNKHWRTANWSSARKAC